MSIRYRCAGGGRRTLCALLLPTLAAVAATRAAADEAPPPLVQAQTEIAEGRRQIEDARAAVAADPIATAALRQTLDELDATFSRLTGLIETSEVAAAEAWSRMACYTAWILSRESKKMAASLRLIQMARSAGDAGETERYQARHEMLLATIADAAERYKAILAEMDRLPAAAVETGLARHEQDLIERGLAEQIRVLNKVKAHYHALAEGSKADVETWKRELEEL